MSPEERRRIQREVEDSFRHLNDNSQSRLLRLAQHLAQHKLLSQLWMGEGQNPEPFCQCTNLN